MCVKYSFGLYKAVYCVMLCVVCKVVNYCVKLSIALYSRVKVYIVC